MKTLTLTQVKALCFSLGFNIRDDKDSDIPFLCEAIESSITALETKDGSPEGKDIRQEFQYAVWDELFFILKKSHPERMKAAVDNILSESVYAINRAVAFVGNDTPIRDIVDIIDNGLASKVMKTMPVEPNVISENSIEELSQTELVSKVGEFASSIFDQLKTPELKNQMSETLAKLSKESDTPMDDVLDALQKRLMEPKVQFGEELSHTGLVLRLSTILGITLQRLNTSESLVRFIIEFSDILGKAVTTRIPETVTLPGHKDVLKELTDRLDFTQELIRERLLSFGIKPELAEVEKPYVPNIEEMQKTFKAAEEWRQEQLKKIQEGTGIPIPNMPQIPNYGYGVAPPYGYGYFPGCGGGFNYQIPANYPNYTNLTRTKPSDDVRLGQLIERVQTAINRTADCIGDIRMKSANTSTDEIVSELIDIIDGTDEAYKMLVKVIETRVDETSRYPVPMF